MQLARSIIVLVAIACLAVLLGGAVDAQDKNSIKEGLLPVDYGYKLAEGVTRRDITFYSDDVPCYATLFLPKGHVASSRTSGVVLAHGWAGTHLSIDKYGARFAEKGLVAMVIDYRGWGLSDGFTTLRQKVKNNDSVRFTQTKSDVVIKRTRLIPYKQVEDVRNAISYLQGEPGVDPEKIGIWGSSFAGGNSIVVAALDARVKAIAMQVPSIGGRSQPSGPMSLRGPLLDDAIKRARTGQGAEISTGFVTRRNIDAETNQMVAEFRPFKFLKDVGERPVLFIVAGKEQLFDNYDHAYAAAEILTGPKKVIEVPNITHFEMYTGAAFETSANAAADWFREYLR